MLSSLVSCEVAYFAGVRPLTDVAIAARVSLTLQRTYAHTRT